MTTPRSVAPRSVSSINPVGRNPGDPNDLTARLARMEERIRALETSRRASSTSVEQGGLLFIRDGRFFLTEAETISEKGTKGRILMSRAGANDDEGYWFVVERAVGVTEWVSDVAFSIRTVDGSLTGDAFIATIQAFDKKGGAFLSDAQGSAPGMGDPKLPVTWHDSSTIKSTTSGAFQLVGAMMWYPYHPNLRIQLLIQNDASTECEISITDGASEVYFEETYPGGYNQYTNITLDRELFEPTVTHVNGNGKFIVVYFRRESGAGTVRAMITDVIGIDLSMF